MNSNFRLMGSGVAAVLALGSLAGCADDAALDGTYTHVASNPSATDSSQIFTQLTINGADCVLLDRAVPAADGDVAGEEMEQECQVGDNALVFRSGDSEAEVPFERTANGDIRLGMGSETVLTKQ
ncbi:hypothetical protein CGLAU_08000 [Corynebacterium glaucum]|uniref:Uncharacterized protein n=1 Tax=Corynebacterium glaucum TaxID=187491 RepID=A0A1Q2HXI0_9CORY|nr:hypothetical protein [Corynebacterium glaucum]AQQ15555.1 hypothetical protein CGLAU_08000 [Corynebacterium glaucum]